MVAAQISTRGGNKEDCTVHETTLLPSIRGFGPLMAMIFCPAMDLKRDEYKSRYISVRTGLGYNEDKVCPYYPEHDTQFALDFELTEDDLKLVSIKFINLIFYQKKSIKNELFCVFVPCYF